MTLTGPCCRSRAERIKAARSTSALARVGMVAPGGGDEGALSLRPGARGKTTQSPPMPRALHASRVGPAHPARRGGAEALPARAGGGAGVGRGRAGPAAAPSAVAGGEAAPWRRRHVLAGGEKAGGGLSVLEGVAPVAQSDQGAGRKGRTSNANAASSGPASSQDQAPTRFRHHPPERCVSYEEPHASQFAQRREVFCRRGTSRRAGAPARATARSDWPVCLGPPRPCAGEPAVT